MHDAGIVEGLRGSPDLRIEIFIFADTDTDRYEDLPKAKCVRELDELTRHVSNNLRRARDRNYDKDRYTSMAPLEIY
jgi:hypothetical protein